MAKEDETITEPEAAAEAARINEQCFLIDNMDLLVPPPPPPEPKGAKKKKKKRRLILADKSIRAADVVSLFNKGKKAQQFLFARPDQLAYLIPQLRLYVPSEDATKKDSIVYFSEYYSPPGTLEKYDGTSDDPEGVIFKENGKGRGAGISQFSFALDNKHPGAVSFVANLEIKFASIRDLAEGPYVSLISPSAKPPGAGGKPSNRQQQIEQQLKTLREQKVEHKKQVKAQSKSLKQKKNVKGILSPRANRLKVIVGWAIPSFDNESVIPGGDKNFYESVKSNQMVLLLSMTNYKLTFGESGEATLSIDYAASIEEAFSGPQSNVFPDSSAYGRRFMVPTKGFNDIENPSKASMEKAYGSSHPQTGTELGKALADPKGWALEQADTFMNKWASSIVGTTEKLAVGAAIPIDEGLVKIDLRILQKQLELLESKEKTDAKEIKQKKRQIENTRLVLTKISSQQRKNKYEYYLTKLTGDGKYTSKVRIVNAPAHLLGRTAVVGTSQPPGSISRRRISERTRLSYSNATAGDQATQGINDVLLAETGEEREEANKKVRVDASLNPLAAMPIKRGTFPIKFILFGDLVDAMIEVLRSAGVPEAQKLILGTVAVPSSKLLARANYVNIADIPISLNAFQVFFLDRVIKSQKSAYPMRLFIQDLIRYLLEPAFNQCGGNPKDGGVSFESTLLTTAVDIKEGSVLKETDTIFEKLSDRDWNSLINSPDANEYMILYSQEKKEGDGSFKEDTKKGVYHLVLGADRGLVKSFSFSQQTSPHLQTQNIVNAANGGSELGVLALPQDATVQMVGNNLFRTGQTIYINAEFAMGKAVARELMLGGYYVVTKVSNTISTSGFETSLDCKWTNFPQAKTGHIRVKNY